ncbi:MAG: hotdog fold thioesterase [Pseudomonadota bacterium]
MIWYNGTLPNVEALNTTGGNSLIEHLDIRIESIGDDHVVGSMPVDHRTHQPYGLLHGGASVALAESLGSLGSALCVDMARYRVVGLDINANHIRGVRSGRVLATATAVHIGRTTHVWSIKQHDSEGRLTCMSRLTMAVIDTEAPRS